MTNEEPLSLNEAVAAQLRGELAAIDWTLVDLSAASGIPKVSVQRYLRGTRSIDVDILDRLARALNTDAAAVLSAAVARTEHAPPPRPAQTQSDRSIPKTG